MRAQFLSYLDELRASYWFIPAVMCVAAVGLSFLTTFIDVRLGPQWLENISWLYANKPSGAHVVLSTIAGSMITVAGVVFSVTIAAVSYASAQYGPRLLTNFMRDRGNQFTLGTFVATFLYCLLVIRTVRSAEETRSVLTTSDSTDAVGAFAPNIAILTGIGLAVCSIAVLIYFVHHVARSIHISHVISDIGKDLRRKISDRFPENLGKSKEELDVDVVSRDLWFSPSGENPGTLSEAVATGEVATVPAGKDGFVQAIDDETLLGAAAEHDLTLRLECRPGNFVQRNSPVIYVWPGKRLTEEIAVTLQGTLICGSTRTPVQDVLFLVDELVEIAARALSPGVNDPFTAKNCLNWLGAALSELSGRSPPDSIRYDDKGCLRVVAQPTTFGDFVDAAFGQMTPYASRDINVSLHMLDTVDKLCAKTLSEAEIDCLSEQVQLLLDACGLKLRGTDLNRLKERAHAVLLELKRPVSG